MTDGAEIHICLFLEERGVLAPCLMCGKPALQELEQLREELEQARKGLGMSMVITQAELEAVPLHATLIDYDGDPYQKISATNFFDYTEQRYLSAEAMATDMHDNGDPVYVPLTIVHVPEAKE